MKTITFEDGTTIELSEQKYNELLSEHKKELTVDEIYNRVKPEYYINARGDVECGWIDLVNVCKAHVPTRKDAEKLQAIARITTVAHYLNGDWKPIWDRDKFDNKHYIWFDTDKNEIRVGGVVWTQNPTVIYYKDKSTAQRAYEICKEEYDLLFS
jgi:hypothetical protein